MSLILRKRAEWGWKNTSKERDKVWMAERKDTVSE